MRRLLIPLVLVVALGVAAVLLAWRTQGPHADLVWTAGPEVATLDPALITALQDGRVAAALFEGLTVFDPLTSKVRPGVASAWTVSPDGLHYTFQLRPDARWSDGRPVTAEDFLYAWRRALDPATAAPYAYMLYPIRGAKAYYDAAQKPGAAKADVSQVGVRAEGLNTLLVDLEQPTAYFLDLAAFSTYLPVRRDVIEKHGQRWTRPENLVSNGAYQLVEWHFRSRMVWQKNPHYWDAAHVPLGRVELRVFEDPKTALLAYETGAVDLTVVVPAVAVQPLLEAQREGRRRDVLYGPSLGTYFYQAGERRGHVLALRDQRVYRRVLLLQLGAGHDLRPTGPRGV